MLHLYALKVASLSNLQQKIALRLQIAVHSQYELVIVWWCDTDKLRVPSIFDEGFLKIMSPILDNIVLIRHSVHKERLKTYFIK